MFQRSLNSMPTDAGHGIRPLPSSGAQSDWGERALQRTWRSLGGLCVLIGLVNAFVPVLPTTVFLLIGAWAYGKGDPALREQPFRGRTWHVLLVSTFRRTSTPRSV